MATYTNLNLPRLSTAVLEGFVKKLAPLTAFSTSFAPEPAGRVRGNSVLVPLIGTLQATDFAGTYAVSGGTKTVITVTLSSHKFVPVGQRDMDALNYSDSQLESFGFQQGAALAQAVVRDVLSLVTSSNFAVVTVAANSALDVAHLRAARLALNQADVPDEGRFVLLDCVGMDALLAVTNFVQAQMFSDRNVLRDGRVRRALDMDFYELNGLFPTGASVLAFVGHPAALAVAMRYIEPQSAEAYDEARPLVDERTGIVLGVRAHYDPNTGTRYISYEANYGYAVGVTTAGRIIKFS